MTLGLSLAGKYPLTGFLVKGPSPSEWLGSLKEWLTRREGDELVSLQVVEGPEGEVLLAQLHPFAEELQISCPRAGLLTLTATTSSCGPGYHQHVVDLAHAMASELNVAWLPDSDDQGDDTGFFGSRDRERLESAMRAHVSELAGEFELAPGSTPALLLPPSTAVPVLEGMAATPLGPRGSDWLDAVRGGDARALDVYPWRHRGRGDEYFLHRALALAWCEVRWRPPTNAAEEFVLREVLRCLRLAREAGAVNLPWREWRDILAWLGEPADDAVEAGARDAAGPLLGHRRGDVRTRLPGDFEMSLPGAFSEEMDEDGTWHGSDGERSVYASGGRLPPAADGLGDAVRTLARMKFEGEPHEFRGERVAGKGGLRPDTDDDGSELHVFGGGAAQDSFLLRLTIIFRKASDRAWALQVFRSIDRSAPGPLVRSSALPGISG